jgi:hypothetical protein
MKKKNKKMEEELSKEKSDLWVFLILKIIMKN